MKKKLAIMKVSIRPDGIEAPVIETDSLTIGNTTITDIVDVSDGNETSLLRAGGLKAVINDAMAEAQEKFDAINSAVTSLSEGMGSPDSIRDIENQSTLPIELHGNADLLYDGVHLTYLMNPTHFEYKNFFYLSDQATDLGRRTLVVPAFLSVAIHSAARVFVLTDLLEIVIPKTNFGRSHYIYACDDGTGTAAPVIIISINSDAPENYTVENSRKIGGFHTLCEDVGNAVTLEHSLLGWKAGTILPNSIWSLNFKPATCDPDAMVYDPKTGKWIDIYLGGNGHSSHRSEKEIDNNVDWYTCQRMLAKQGKVLLDEVEFLSAAHGSPENVGLVTINTRVDLGLDLLSPTGGALILAHPLGTGRQHQKSIVDTIRGPYSRISMSFVGPIIPNDTFLFTEFLSTGLCLKEKSPYAGPLLNAPQGLFEAHYCTETIITDDGTEWRYNPETKFGFCKYGSARDGGLKTISNPSGISPAMVWIKAMNSATSTVMYLDSQGPGRFGTMADDSKFTDSLHIFANTSMTSETISLGHHPAVNGHSITFTTVTSPLAAGLSSEAVGTDGHIVVVVGEKGKIITSYNGIDWVIRDNANGTTQWFNYIDYDGSKFTIYANNDTEVQTSPDGINWTYVGSVSGQTHAPSFVASNGAYSMRVGPVLDPSNPPGNPDYGEIRTSMSDDPYDDSWIKHDSITPNNPLRGVGFFKGKWIVVGHGGLIHIGSISSYDEYMMYAWFPEKTPMEGNNAKHRIVWDEADTAAIAGIDLTVTLFKVLHNNNMMLLLGSSGTILHTTDKKTWILSSPAYAYTSTWYGGTTFNTNSFIIVGDVGEIQTSINGVDWVHHDNANAFTGRFRGVAAGPSALVAVGDNGTIQYSIDDGSTWNSTSSAGSYTGQFYDVVWGNGSFVAVGGDSEIQISTDGITWSRATVISNDFSDLFTSVNWNGSIFLVTGNGGELQTSYDGINWTHSDNASGTIDRISDVVWDGSTFTLLGSRGQVQTSHDGIGWESIVRLGNNKSFHSISYFDGALIAVGEDCTIKIARPNHLMVSADTTICEMSHNNYDGSCIDVGFAPDTVMIHRTDASDAIRVIYRKQNNFSAFNLYNSRDTSSVEPIVGRQLVVGTKVQLSELNDFGNYLVVAFREHANGYAVVAGAHRTDALTPAYNVGLGADYNSPNSGGMIWNADDSSSAALPMRFIEPSLPLWDTNLTVGAFNNSGFTLRDTNRLLNKEMLIHAWHTTEAETIDGITWRFNRASGFAYSVQQRRGGGLPDISVVGFGTVLDIAYLDGLFVMVGEEGLIKTSTNGIDWTDRRYNKANWSAVAYGLGIWLISDATSRRMASSKDGIVWRDTGYVAPEEITKIFFTGTMFLAVGENNCILTSVDGLLWVSQSAGAGIDPSIKFNYATSNESLMVIVGDGGTIQTSPNGTDWTNVSTSIGHPLSAIVWTGTQFIAVGSGEYAYVSTAGTLWDAKIIPPRPSYEVSKISVFGDIVVIVHGEGGYAISSDKGNTWSKAYQRFSTTAISGVASNGTSCVVTGRGKSYRIEVAPAPAMSLPIQKVPLVAISSREDSTMAVAWTKDHSPGKVSFFQRYSNTMPVDMGVVDEQVPEQGLLPHMVQRIGNNFDEERLVTFINLVWFAPDDPSVGQCLFIDNDGSVESVIDTSVIAPTAIVISRLDDTEFTWKLISKPTSAPNYWISDLLNNTADGRVVEVSSNKSPVLFESNTVTIKADGGVPSGRFLLMVMGESKHNGFVTKHLPKLSAKVTPGRHSGSNHARLISNIGIEDATGYLWQYLKDTAGYNSNDDSVWEYEEGGSGRGYIYSSSDADSYCLIAGGPSETLMDVGTEGRRGDVRKTEDGRNDLTYRGCAKSLGKCPY